MRLFGIVGDCSLTNFNFFVLDVGCGGSPVGDVNCDLYINDVNHHRTIKHTDLYHINSRLVPNFVCCEASHLPFKSECFDLVMSRQVIEHVPKPELMAAEMVRCSKNIVIIETVHRRGERLGNRESRKFMKQCHPNKFDWTYFGKLAKMLKVNLVLNQATDYLPLFSFKGFSLPFPLFPFGIRIVFCKKHTDFSVLKKRSDPKVQYLESVGL